MAPRSGPRMQAKPPCHPPGTPAQADWKRPVRRSGKGALQPDEVDRADGARARGGIRLGQPGIEDLPVRPDVIVGPGPAGVLGIERLKTRTERLVGRQRRGRDAEPGQICPHQRIRAVAAIARDPEREAKIALKRFDRSEDLDMLLVTVFAPGVVGHDIADAGQIPGEGFPELDRNSPGSAPRRSPVSNGAPAGPPDRAGVRQEAARQRC